MIEYAAAIAVAFCAGVFFADGAWLLLDWVANWFRSWME